MKIKLGGIHQTPLLEPGEGGGVIFAFTRRSDVRFEFVIKMSDIFRRSFGFEHHFLTQKDIFAAARVNVFFVTPCAGNKVIQKNTLFAKNRMGKMKVTHEAGKSFF